jgi:hypothetical protein
MRAKMSLPTGLTKHPSAILLSLLLLMITPADAEKRIALVSATGATSIAEEIPSDDRTAL